MKLIDKLIEHFDGVPYRAAVALGVSHQLFYQWQKHGYIPHKHGYLVQDRTGGAITAEDVWRAAANERIES